MDGGLWLAGAAARLRECVDGGLWLAADTAGRLRVRSGGAAAASGTCLGVVSAMGAGIVDGGTAANELALKKPP